MARITETKLYNSIKEGITSITRKELAKELAIVKARGFHINWDVKHLGSAFVWETSPQGHAFWMNLDKEETDNAKPNN